MPRRRARSDDGRYQGDDPATPDVNEAWDHQTDDVPTAEPPSAAIVPSRRRRNVPDVVRVPESSGPPMLRGEDLLSYCAERGDEIDADAVDADAAVDLAHRSLETFVGAAIPRFPSSPERVAILQAAYVALVRGFHRRPELMREFELPAIARAPFLARRATRPQPRPVVRRGVARP